MHIKCLHTNKMSDYAYLLMHIHKVVICLIATTHKIILILCISCSIWLLLSRPSFIIAFYCQMHQQHARFI